MLAIGYCSFSAPDNESCPIDPRHTLVMGSRLIAGGIARSVQVKRGGCVAEPRSLSENWVENPVLIGRL